MNAIKHITAAMLAIVIASPALADDYAVSRIKYVNEGGYVASFDVEAQDFKGNTIPCGEQSSKSNTLASGQSVTIVVSQGAGAPSTKCKVDPGFEVWGIASISQGLTDDNWSDRKCRKDKARFFAHPEGGTLVVVTRGTTLDNNRCRIRSNGGVRWTESIHGQNIYQD